jgi:hypothetical protein
MNLLKIQQKIPMSCASPEHEGYNDIYRSVTFLREAARPEKVVDAGHPGQQ